MRRLKSPVASRIMVDTVWFVSALAVVGFAASQPPDMETVLSRASDYVHRYEQDLGMLIAREEYVQRVPAGGSASMPAAPGLAGNIRTPFVLEDQERRLLSDFMMIRLPSEGDQWAAFRAVLEVDGRPVRDRDERLRELLGGSVEEAVEQWRKLSKESARYNIGNVTRSTNIPTFALLILRRENVGRFDFELTDRDRIEGLDVWEISFEEKDSPTFITDAIGQEIFTHGKLWVDPEDGRVVRTEVRTGDKTSALRSRVTVRYEPNRELDIWVPRDMKELYEVGDGEIEAFAEYSNFQRFEVSVDTTISK